MEDNIIDKAFEEGQTIKSYLYKLQGENSNKTIERFSYKFLEGLRRKDGGDLTANIIRLYCSIEERQIPDFFKNLLVDISSMSQIGYAFLLGLNSYKEGSKSSVQENIQVTKEEDETNVNGEEE